MNMATTRPSPGLSRANTRSGSTSTSRSPSSASRDDGRSFAAAPRAQAAAPTPPSALRDVSDIVVGVALMLGVLFALLMLTLYTRDSMVVGKALQDQGTARGTLICKDGKVARGDGSLPDRIVEDGVFVCTDWRTLQAIEQEEADRGMRKY
ncbi:hypothetical protein ACQ859_06700 [Roseateles chitinivorans]|uniref:hypothetical protein n=1 Tax=Roseateles chitinivorans TaxID=2917965 RepID=UPI003D672E99